MTPSHLAGLTALLRPRLSLMTTASGLAGYLLGAPSDGSLPFALLGGLFLLAGGASAFNQIQERRKDALMSRTVRRPLPSGRVPVREAAAVGTLCCALGLLLLWIQGSAQLFLAGSSVLLCYNLLYTPLKEKSCLALVPGALVGAAPPLIGSLAATGSHVPAQALLLSGLIFLWQFPHFWLLALRHREDYLRADLPTLSSRLEPAQFRRILIPWMFALVCLPLLFAALELIQSGAGRALAVSATFLPLWALWMLFRSPQLRRIDQLFRHNNLYMAILLLAIGIEALLG